MMAAVVFGISAAVFVLSSATVIYNLSARRALL